MIKYKNDIQILAYSLHEPTQDTHPMEAMAVALMAIITLATLWAGASIIILY